METKIEDKFFEEITGHIYSNLGGGFSFDKRPVKEFIIEAYNQGIQKAIDILDEIDFSNIIRVRARKNAFDTEKEIKEFIIEKLNQEVRNEN